MNPYLCAAGAYLGRVFDAKTLVTLVLIGCSTWLAHDRVIDAATWSVLITVFGGVWGAAAAVGSPTMQDAIKSMRRDES